MNSPYNYDLPSVFRLLATGFGMDLGNQIAQGPLRKRRLFCVIMQVTNESSYAVRAKKHLCEGAFLFVLILNSLVLSLFKPSMGGSTDKRV